MSSVKSNPEGLKVVECERGVGGKNAPIRYIPEQDPVQDALEKAKKTTYFKLTLPNTGSELKVAIWASGTPEQFLLHVRTAMHVCKQLGLETKEADAMMALEAAYCKLDAAKAEYTKLYKEAKQKARDKDENPATDSRKKAKDPRDKTDNSAPDVTADTIALGAAKKAREEAQKKVEEAAPTGPTEVELLTEIRRTETEHGRIRLERWGSRTLDIDIVTYGDVLKATKELTIPHPRAFERAFVLVPWALLDPQAVLPGYGKVADLAEPIKDQVWLVK